MSKIFITFILLITPFVSFCQEVEIKNLPTTINTIGSEMNFIQINKDSALYSSSSLENGKFQSLIFRTKLEFGEWGEGKYYDLGESFSYANISFCKKDSSIYFSVIDELGNGKIAFKDHKKSRIQFLNNKINLENSNNTHPHITSYDDKNILYFASNRKGGVGGYDIWFCIIDKFGHYGEPINAGNKINTKYNEITPFYNIWNEELFFSSNRDENNNGIDIYKSKGSLNLWSPSKRVEELNSKEDDLYISFYNKHSGYFSSNRKNCFYDRQEKENCCNDIFSFTYTKKDSVPNFNDTIKKHLPIKLYFHNDEPNPKTLRTSTETTYKESYISYYILKNEYLKINPTIEIEDFFDHTLKKNYNKLNSTLEYVLKKLIKGKTVELHIKGFASPLHDKQYNINLSKRRISSLMNLISSFENGQLKNYIATGKLKIIKLPLGETKSKKYVSDNPKDRKKSVYSIGAMLERKIEIVEIIEL